MRPTPVTGVLVCLLLGCGDDDRGTVDTATATSTDTTADTQVADTATSLTDAITETAAEVAAPPVDETLRFMFEGAPMADVAVTRFDGSGAVVAEVWSDAKGEVTLAGIDYADGGLTVTWLLPPANYGGMIGAQPADLPREGGVVVIRLERRPGTGVDLISVSGDALGMADTSHTLTVLANLPGIPFSEKKGARWKIDDVPPSTEIELVAFEWSFGPEAGPRRIDQEIVAWTDGICPASDGDAQVVLDFARPLAAKTVSGTFSGPTGPGVSLDAEGTGVVTVLTLDDDVLRGIVGVTTRSVRGLAGLVTYTVEWVEPAWATNVATLYRTVSPKEWTAALVAGWPSAAVAPTLWAPPTLESPAANPISEAEPIRWSGVAPEAFAFVEVMIGAPAERQTVGRFDVYHASEVVLPALPGGFTVAELEGGQVVVRVGACEPSAPADGIGVVCKRIAVSRAGVVTR